MAGQSSARSRARIGMGEPTTSRLFRHVPATGARGSGLAKIVSHTQHQSRALDQFAHSALRLFLETPAWSNLERNHRSAPGFVRSSYPGNARTFTRRSAPNRKPG